MTPDDDPDLLRLTRFWDARGREDPRRYSVPGGAELDDPSYLASGEELLETVAVLVDWSPDATAVVVDVGCGAGRVAHALAGRVAQVAAYDLSSAMVEAARRRLAGRDNVTVQRAAAGDLSWQESASADAVLLLGVLPHLLDETSVVEALREAARVLDVGGSVLFDARTGPVPMVLPGEERVPSYVAEHPVWQGSQIELESLAAIAYEAGLEIERIVGSETGRCLVLAERS